MAPCGSPPARCSAATAAPTPRRGAYQEPGGGLSWGARVGDPDPRTGTLSEHRAPSYLVQVGLTSMPDR